MGLYSNFLIWNEGTKSLEFIHSSAENFIRNLNIKQDKIAEGDEEKFFSDYRNHESVARLYMDLIGSATHPYWTEVGIEINKWDNLTSDSAERGSFMSNLENVGNEGHVPDGILVRYFRRHGLRHFSRAAREQSLDDPVWKDFIQRLVLPSDSAFGAFLLSDTDDWFWNHFPRRRVDTPLFGSSRSCLHLEGGRLRILPSHILAWLPVFDGCDRECSTSTRDTAGAHDCVQLLKDMCTRGGNFEDYVPGENRFTLIQRSPVPAHALHLACSCENAGAVRAILNAAKLLSPNALSEMLRSNTQLYSFPLFITIELRNVTIASILLEADRQPVSENVETSGAEGLPFTYTSSQWNLKQENYLYVHFKQQTLEHEYLKYKNILEYDLILMEAVKAFEEEDMLTLLKVARPENITERLRTWMGKNRSNSGHATSIWFFVTTAECLDCRSFE